jgi:hypothetical protein
MAVFPLSDEPRSTTLGSAFFPRFCDALFLLLPTVVVAEFRAKEVLGGIGTLLLTIEEQYQCQSSNYGCCQEFGIPQEGVR